MLACCTCTGELGMEGWQIWTDHPIREQYEVVMDLGEGGFAQVVLGKHKKIPGKYMALKVVFMQNPDLDEEHKAVMRGEAQFLRALSHPSIVSCEDVVEDSKQMVLVMEHLRGGQLLDDLHKIAEDNYTEQQAATIFKQIAEGVAYLHENNVMHRDLKPENIIFASDPVTARADPKRLKVKLIDLGMAAKFDASNPIKGALGSPGFISPEIIDGAEHDFSMDMYALGVILFVMLVGRKPFNVKDCEELSYIRIPISDAPGLKDPRWLNLSDGAQDLVMGLLSPVKDRISAKETLQHEWLVNCAGSTPRPLDSNVVRGAANVASMRRLRHMSRGAMALEPSTSQGRTKEDTAKDFKRRLKLEKENADRSRGHRDGSTRGLSRMESMALRVNAAAAGKLHDRGHTADPNADISVHYRSGGNYARGGSGTYSSHMNGGSLRGGSMRGMKDPDSSSRGGMRRFTSLRGSRSGVELSSMDQDEFRRRTTSNVTTDLSGSDSGRSREGPQMRALRSISGNLRDLMDSSVRSGNQYKDSSVRSGSQHKDSSQHGAPADPEGINSNQSAKSQRRGASLKRVFGSNNSLKDEAPSPGNSGRGLARYKSAGPDTIQEHESEGRTSLDYVGPTSRDDGAASRVRCLQPLSEDGAASHQGALKPLQ